MSRVTAIISPWFVHSRPTALVKAYNGASIGGVIFSQFWVGDGETLRLLTLQGLGRVRLVRARRISTLQLRVVTVGRSGHQRAPGAKSTSSLGHVTKVFVREVSRSAASGCCLLPTFRGTQVTRRARDGGRLARAAQD